MANIQVHVDSKKQLTIYTVTGEVTWNEIADALENYYSNDPTVGVLWDFRAIDTSDLSRRELINILSVAKKYAHQRKNGKTAIVVSNDLSFGISRMYKSYAEIYEHPIDHRITKDYDEAMKWLVE
jgi:hypothetical protein